MAPRTLQQQVRAREMEHERQQAQKLKQQKEKKRQKLVERINELWREEQEARIEALAEDCAIALRCIGQSHAAAALFVQKQEEMKIDRHKQAMLNQHRESSRFKIALQKERLRRKLESDPAMVAKQRKKVRDFAAQWERSLGRFLSHTEKFRLLSRRFPKAKPCGWFAEHKEDLSLLQPSDYKHTFLHSRLFINTDDGNCPAKDNEMDAWKAAELQRQLVNSYRIMQMQIRDVMDKRKILRGHLARSQLTIEKKLQLLEHENIAFEKTEKEIRRNTLDQQNSDKMSKAQPQCIDKSVLESSKPVNTNSSDLPDKTSRIMDHSLDKGEKEEVPQGFTFIDCGSKQMLHISAVGEDRQNNAEEREKKQVIDQSGTSILCCDEDIKICLDSSTAVVKIDCQKNSRKLPRRAPSCKSNKQAYREQFHDCDKGLIFESLKVDCDSSDTKTNENKSVAHSPAGDKKKSVRRAAGIKSILPLHKDQKKKPELRTLPAQKQVKAVKFS